jgi:hypothetical protein
MHPDDFIAVGSAPHWDHGHAHVHIRFPEDQYPALARALGWHHWWSWRVHGVPDLPVADEAMERMTLVVSLPRRSRTPDRQWHALRRLVTDPLRHVPYEVLGVIGYDGTDYLPRT